MREIPAEIQYDSGRPVAVEFCPVCGDELSEFHQHPVWRDHEEYPGQHMAVRVPGSFTKDEVAQDADGEWWHLAWDNIGSGLWQLARPVPITPDEAVRLVEGWTNDLEEYRDGVQRRIDEIDAWLATEDLWQEATIR